MRAFYIYIKDIIILNFLRETKTRKRSDPIIVKIIFFSWYFL